jgi:toxin ParE1/3/4
LPHGMRFREEQARRYRDVLADPACDTITDDGMNDIFASAWRLVAVPSFRPSARARADLIDIYDFTEAGFGAHQADAYHAGRERTFGLLADFPRIGRAADELRSGYRRFRFQSHFVFYTAEADGVLIRAVLHAAKDIRPQLFD